MIPSTWAEHRRDEDNELVGYLRPDEYAPGRYVPVTVFGYPLHDEPMDEAEAQFVLESIGLSYLADRWLLSTHASAEPIAVQIVEASPERLVVKNVDFGSGHEIGKRFVLDVPEASRLRKA